MNDKNPDMEADTDNHSQAAEQLNLRWCKIDESIDH